MKSSQFRFGTDGWRAVIDDEFTLPNVKRVASAVGRYVLQAASGKAPGGRPVGGLPAARLDRPRILVGYDTRRLSPESARAAADSLTDLGIDVYLSTGFAPTPALATCVVRLDLDGALIITASHNPASYNGIKFKPPYGGSATQEIIAAIEAELEDEDTSRTPHNRNPHSKESKGALTELDPAPIYLTQLRELVDFEAIRSRAPRIVADVLCGAAQGYFNLLNEELGGGFSEFHSEVNPTFCGLNPEPIPPNLGPLIEHIKKHPVDLALALDGDGDRIGGLDPDGNFLSSHHIFSLILRYLAGIKGERGSVIKTVSTTRMIDLLAERYEIPLTITPVGFKNIAPYLFEDAALMAGEESGGIWVRGHIPERDGILIGLLLVELLCKEGPVAEQLRRLFAEVGPHYYDRIDVEVQEDERSAIRQTLDGYRPESIGGRPVAWIELMDGYKYGLSDGSWLMIRPSGTEAVVRIYAEAATQQGVERLLQVGRGLVEGRIEGREG